MRMCGVGSEIIFNELESINNCRYTIERAHHDAVKRYYSQLSTRTGTRDNPIGDDNYLWLKSRVIREMP